MSALRLARPRRYPDRVLLVDLSTYQRRYDHTMLLAVFAPVPAGIVTGWLLAWLSHA